MKNDKLYISISEKDVMIGVLCFENKKSMNSTVFDAFYDNGYIIKEITKEDYDNYDEGDEITLDDLQNGNYCKDDDL